MHPSIGSLKKQIDGYVKTKYIGPMRQGARLGEREFIFLEDRLCPVQGSDLDFFFLIYFDCINLGGAQDSNIMHIM